MPSEPQRGFTLLEALLALGLMAGVGAAMLPALAAAGALHREAAIETSAALAATSELAHVLDAVARGDARAGGSVSMSLEGWSASLDETGERVSGDGARYLSRWQTRHGPPGVRLVTVAILPIGADSAVTVTTAVSDD